MKIIDWERILKDGERFLRPFESKENEIFTLADINETKVKVIKIYEADSSHKGLHFKTKTMYVEFVKGKEKHPLFSGINMQTGEDEFKAYCYMSVKVFCRSAKVPISN